MGTTTIYLGCNGYYLAFDGVYFTLQVSYMTFIHNVFELINEI